MRSDLQKRAAAANRILFLCAMICLVCYDIFGGLWLKGLTSSWFVILGLYNLVYAKKQLGKLSGFLILMELGLIFGMCADVLLGVQFLLGIAFFALGHICYLVSFCLLEKFRKQDLYAILPLAALSLFVVAGTPYIQVEDSFLEKLLLVYAVIIACMLGKAACNVHCEKSTYRKLLLLGSAMFWFSDVMLAIDMFGQSSRLTWILCSYTYWPAQNLLALSLFHFTQKHKPE